MTESIPAPFLVWTDLRWEKINLNFPKQKGDTSDKKKPSNKHQGFGWSSRLFGTSLHSQPEKSCNIFLARGFVFFLSPCMHVHTLSQPESTPGGRVQAGKTSPQKYRSSHLCYRLHKQQVKTLLCCKDLPTSWQTIYWGINSSGLSKNSLFPQVLYVFRGSLR